MDFHNFIRSAMLRAGMEGNRLPKIDQLDELFLELEGAWLEPEPEPQHDFSSGHSIDIGQLSLPSLFPGPTTVAPAYIKYLNDDGAPGWNTLPIPAWLIAQDPTAETRLHALSKDNYCSHSTTITAAGQIYNLGHPYAESTEAGLEIKTLVQELIDKNYVIEKPDLIDLVEVIRVRKTQFPGTPLYVFASDSISDMIFSGLREERRQGANVIVVHKEIFDDWNRNRRRAAAVVAAPQLKIQTEREIFYRYAKEPRKWRISIIYLFKTRVEALPASIKEEVIQPIRAGFNQFDF